MQARTVPRWTAAEDDQRLPVPLPAHADLVVVGLGAAGLAAAACAAQRGLAVVGVDAGAIGDGASGRNGGFLLAGGAQPHHVLAERLGRRAATALYRRTLEALAAERALRPEALHTDGSLRLADDEAERSDCRAQVRAMRRDGLPVEEAEGPWGGGLRFPSDAGMDPGRRCRALLHDARSAGAALVSHTAVTALDAGRVRTARGVVTAPRVLVAVDGGLEHLVDGLGVSTARNQVLATAPGAVDAERVPAPVYARWGYDYWQRLPDGSLVVGGARDRGGPAEWTSADGTSPVVQRALEHIARSRLGVTAPVTHRWSGALAFTDDRLPRCRVVRRSTGSLLAVTGGYCGVGNLIGPLAAVAAVALLVDGDHPDARLIDPAGG